MRVLVRFTLHRPHQYASVLARHLSDGSKRTPPSPQPVVKRPLTELQTLTKAPTKLTSLRFKHVRPGVALHLTWPPKHWNRRTSVDPSHASMTVPGRSFPHFQSPLFSMRAFPFAVLERFSSEGWPFPVNHAQLAKFQRNKRRAPMPIAFVLSKKNVHSRTVVRTTIKRRTLEVLRLIVTKGAHVNSDSVIVFRDEDVGYERWIMKDWIYIYYPTLEMYRRPFYDVIPVLRDALETIKSRAQQMEISWQNVNMNQGPSGAASSRVLPMRRNGPTSTPKTSAGRRPRTNSGHTPNSQPPPATSLN